MAVIYFLPHFFAFALLICGKEFNDYYLTAISGVAFFIIGVSFIINPLPTLDSLINDIVSHVTWGTGVYVMLRSAMELYKEYS